MDERYFEKEAKKIGSRIRKIQKYHNLLNKEMEDFLSVSRSTYGYYLSGERRLSLNTLILLRDKLKPNMNYLFYGEDNEPVIFQESKIDDTEKQDFEEISHMLMSYLSSLPGEELPEAIGKLQILQGEMLLGLNDSSIPCK